MRRVSGHVVLNHAAICLNRFRKPLTETQVQRSFVQSVALSVPGQSSPLLYLEGGLFPRLFYASLSQDAIAPLGALPLFSYMDKKIRTAWHPSFNTFEYVSRPFRLTQAGTSIIERGFQVDPDSSLGMPVQGESEGGLADIMDSRQMSRNMCASQEYVLWDSFHTITVCQKDTPGVAHINDWVRLKGWTREYPGYDRLSIFEWEECVGSQNTALSSLSCSSCSNSNSLDATCLTWANPYCCCSLNHDNGV